MYLNYKKFIHRIIPLLLAFSVMAAMMGCNATGQAPSDQLFGSIDSSGVLGVSTLGNAALKIGDPGSNFGTIAVGANVSTSVSVQNISNGIVFLSSFSINLGTNYSITANTCPLSPAAFAANSTCQVTVKFTPISSGTLPDALTVKFGTSAGDSSLANSGTLTGIGAAPLIFAGADPINSANVTTVTIGLTWPNLGTASSYNAYYKLTGAGSFTLAANVPAGSTSYMVTGLTKNTSYTFRVRALNALGIEDTNTNDRIYSTDDIGSFTTPTTLAAVVGSTATSVDVGAFCTDARSHYPTGMSMTAQSNAHSNCSVTGSPFKLQCTPTGTSGTIAWSSTITLSCLLNSYPTPYSQTMTVNVTDPGGSTVVAAPTSVAADGATSSTVTVTLKDSFSGTAIAGKTISLASSRATSDTISPATAVTNGLGVATFAVTSTNSGASVLTATDTTDTVTLTAAPTVTFTSVPASAALSFVNAYPASLKADGTTSSTVTVSLIGANGNPVGGKTVTLASGRGATDTILPASVSASPTGIASFTVVSSTPGLATLTATDTTDTVTVTQTFPIYFLAQTPTIAYRASLGASGNAAGSNATPTASWKDIHQSATANDGTLTNFAYSVLDGWAGAGTSANPSALACDGSTHSSYVDFGQTIKNYTSISFEAWIKPTANTASGAVILGNGSTSVAGTTSTDKGFTLKQSSLGSAQIQLGIGARSYADEIMADSPMAYWRLGETSGVTAFDSSGNGHHAGYYGGYTLGQAHTGGWGDSDKAVLFNGSSGFVDLNGNLMNGLNNFTISFWIYLNAYPPGGKVYRMMAECGDPGNNCANTDLFTVNMGATGALSLETMPGGVYKSTSATTSLVPLSTWTHIAVVRNGAAVDIYVNGVDNSLTGFAAGALFSTLHFVTATQEAFGVYLNGLFDEIAVFPSALGLARIQAQIAAATRATCTSQSALANNIWNHIAGTFDSLATPPALTLYINGLQQCSVTDTGAIYAGSTSNLRYAIDGSAANAWTGKAAEARVYSAVLTPADVSTNWAVTNPQFPVTDVLPVVHNLMLWLRADEITGVGDGASMALWRDSSGNGNAVFQTTVANQPIYKASVFNSRPAVRFNAASSQAMSNTTLLTAGNFASSQATEFVVYQLTGTVTQYGVLTTGTSTNQGYWRWAGDGNAYLGEFRGTRLSTYPLNMPSTGAHLMSVRSGAANYEARLDGVSAGVQAISWGLTPTFMVGIGPPSIYFTGDIAEVLIYNTALTDTERAAVEAYLAAKYGVP